MLGKKMIKKRFVKGTYIKPIHLGFLEKGKDKTSSYNYSPWPFIGKI